jgi:hypothetical protein
VKFNGVPASFAPLPGETDRLSVTVPDGVSTGPVTVTTPLGTATSPAPFYHVAITGFDPTDGGVGTEVTVTGVGFTELPITLVALGGFIMPGLAVDDDSHLRFTVSDLAVTGKIMIRMAAGDVFSADNFVVPMTITDFTPTSGPVGTAVVVTGTGWVFPDGVQFNGIPAPFFYDPITRELHTGVPDGATTGPITVSVGAQSATSAENFTVTP